jgi:hypothetical protein
VACGSVNFGVIGIVVEELSPTRRIPIPIGVGAPNSSHARPRVVQPCRASSAMVVPKVLSRGRRGYDL